MKRLLPLFMLASLLLTSTPAEASLWATTTNSDTTAQWRNAQPSELPPTTVNAVNNLTPLFTASINAQTLGFVLSTFAAHTFYGNNTGSTAAPAAAVIGTADLPSSVATSSGNCAPLFTSSITGQALSFSLSNAPAYSILGNFTASAAVPSYNTSVLPPSLLPSNVVLGNQSGSAGAYVTGADSNGHFTYGTPNGGVSSVSNSDGTLSIPQTTGSVAVSIANNVTLPGTPTVGTPPSTSDSSSKVATTQFVKNNLGNYLPLAGGTISGNLNVTTQSPGDNSTNTATTAYADNSAATAASTAQGNAESYAANASNLSSGTVSASRMPAFTGDVTTSAGSTVTAIKSSVNLAGSPTTTTQATSDNSTKIATTAYVQSAVSNISDNGAAGGSNNQIEWNNVGALDGFTASGDATIDPSSGAVSVTKTGGVAFAPSATIDTTNGSNVTSGTVPDARLSSNIPLKNGSNVFTGSNDFSGTTKLLIPLLGSDPSSSPGAIWFNGAAFKYWDNTSVTPTKQTVATQAYSSNASNLSSGAVPAGQMPAFTGAITTSAGSTATSIQSSINLPGNPTTTTQTAGDDSTKVSTTAYADDAVATALTAAESYSGNASNLTSGTVSDSRLSSDVLTATNTQTVSGKSIAGSEINSGNIPDAQASTHTFLVNQSNTISTGTQDFTAATKLLIPLLSVDPSSAPGSIWFNGSVFKCWDNTSVTPVKHILAYLDSPTFTGVPAGPTATSGTNTTQLATTAFVQSAVGAVPGGSSGQLQVNNGTTLTGLPAMNGDATLNTTTGAISVSKTGGVAFAASATTNALNASNITSGTLPAAQLPSAAVQTGQSNTYTTGTQDMTSATAFKIPLLGTDLTTSSPGGIWFNGSVFKVIDNTSVTPVKHTIAYLDSPTFTGSPAAPTQSALDNSTKLATTAYTDGAVATGVSTAESVAANASNLSSGTVNASRLPSTVVQTGQSNTYTTGTQDMSAATAAKVPTVSTGNNTTNAASTAFVASTFAAPPALGSTTPAAVTTTALTVNSSVSVPNNSVSLSALAAGGATNGQAVVYNSGTGLWAPGTVSGAGGGLSDGGNKTSSFTASVNTAYWISGTATCTLPAPAAGEIDVYIASGGAVTFNTTSGSIYGASAHASGSLVDSTVGRQWRFVDINSSWVVSVKPGI